MFRRRQQDIREKELLTWQTQSICRIIAAVMSGEEAVKAVDGITLFPEDLQDRDADFMPGTQPSTEAREYQPGICADCGNSIDQERLNVYYGALYCTSCQEIRDEQQRQYLKNKREAERNDLQVGSYETLMGGFM